MSCSYCLGYGAVNIGVDTRASGNIATWVFSDKVVGPDNFFKPWHQITNNIRRGHMLHLHVTGVSCA